MPKMVFEGPSNVRLFPLGWLRSRKTRTPTSIHRRRRRHCFCRDPEGARPSVAFSSEHSDATFVALPGTSSLQSTSSNVVSHPRLCTSKGDYLVAITRVKGHLDLDRSDLFIKRHTRKDGKPTNEAAKHVIEKLKSLKSTQPPSDDSTPHQVAARNDTYTQVLGPDRPDRVSGVGTSPTQTSMWGNESKEALRTENRLLMQRMEELETTMAEKFAKMESMIRGSQAKNDGKCAPSPHVDVHMTSAVEGQTVDQDVKCIIDCGDVSKLIGKCVLLVDIEMQHVANGILISTEIEKVVMGCKIGTEYYEVSITHAQRPNTSLFVKDQFRKRLSDALGSHILWLKDYCIQYAKTKSDCIAKEEGTYTPREKMKKQEEKDNPRDMKRLDQALVASGFAFSLQFWCIGRRWPVVVAVWDHLLPLISENLFTPALG
ncbi:hypothetical protein Taro_011686 [Colocasia esculenta]|uniref:Uncharacterized protein n=1 Tax=Colocasia esculenta TaxID=4460 RepID=A0A843UAP7_COLES|nr:hypothetical protein [Colocasia esculenta]